MTRPVFDAQAYFAMKDAAQTIGKLADEVTDVLPVVVDMVKDIGRFEPRAVKAAA